MNQRQKKKQTNRKPFDKVHSAARYEIAVYIGKQAIKAGIEPNKRAIWSYTRWLAHNMSEDDWYKTTLIACGVPRGVFTKSLWDMNDEEIEFLEALGVYKAKED